ncbi:MAG: hypothetical protein HOD63_12495 [Bacteroidetes bacterium]|jgi:phage-related minor tail protein|nr:hypothetical protein [Bacteroidota bacterium]MBT5528524.1 hypothetical protein [Cytophagia bacterium]MBT3422693.1 hypothetical protein [Bacteroidota bacterium]MBT3800092.1 hypothetical protein [Bacteroidota bacterium]MBT3934692.1 hypothetical protein [Bacteroidota bacterium]
MEFDYKQFYVELGKLLSAIAKADGKVQLEEVHDLHKLVRNVLLKVNDQTDEFGTNHAFYTEFEFETMLDSKAEMDEAYDSFIKFITDNKENITDKMKEICMVSVEKIADSFEGIVPEEKTLIDKLKKDLDKI